MEYKTLDYEDVSGSGAFKLKSREAIETYLNERGDQGREILHLYRGVSFGRFWATQNGESVIRARMWRPASSWDRAGLWLAAAGLLALDGCVGRDRAAGDAPAATANGVNEPRSTLDLREPMALAARAVARRLDPAHEGRPWFLIAGGAAYPWLPSTRVGTWAT